MGLGGFAAVVKAAYQNNGDQHQNIGDSREVVTDGERVDVFTCAKHQKNTCEVDDTWHEQNQDVVRVVDVRSRQRQQVYSAMKKRSNKILFV